MNFRTRNHNKYRLWRIARRQSEMYVENRVALITGGVSGIGLSYAQEFLKNGIRGVCLMDVDDQKAQETIPLLEDQYGPNKAIFVKGDITNDTVFEHAFKKTIEMFGNIDIVVNNAGIGSERNYKKTIDINLSGLLTGTLLAFDQYLPQHKSAEDPVIVNISSTYGLDGCPFATAYTATKHGVIGIGKSLKPHYETTGVKIITICPGFTSTPLAAPSSNPAAPGRNTKFMMETFSKAKLQPPEVVARFLVKILDNCNTGDVWVIDEERCYQIEIPDRFSLNTLKTIQL